MARGTRVLVLNGRQRLFELTPSTWRAYLLRRALEKSFIFEGVFAVVFLIGTPFLIVWDWMRGRR